MNRFHRWVCRSGAWRWALEHKLLPWALEGIELGNDVLEVGAGPGLTTELLRHRAPRLTSVEIDPQLAEALKRRMQGTNVTVIRGDGTAMPFDNASFSAAVCFTMLHHVPSSDLQDKLLAEVYRVLRPGGVFAGTDSTWSIGMELIHLWDTMVTVDPRTFAERLQAVGFREVIVDCVRRTLRFRAWRPIVTCPMKKRMKVQRARKCRLRAPCRP